MKQVWLSACLLWGWHVVLAAPFVAGIVLVSRRRVRWSKWDALVLVVPCTAWLMTGHWVARTKSLANLGEFAFVSAIVVATVAARAVAGHFANSVAARVLLLVIATVAAIGVYVLTPVWPEVDETVGGPNFR